MNKVRISAIATTRLRFAAGVLDDWDHPNEAWILAPARSAADAFVREYRAGPGQHGQAGLHRTTVLALARELAVHALAREGRTPVSGVGVEALVARAAGLAKADGRLRYFEEVAETLGFGRALVRTIREIRLAGIRAADLEGHGESGSDLARLLERYEGEMNAMALTDSAGVLEAATLAVRNAPPEGPLLLLDVWPRCRTEEKFLEALAGSGATIAVVVPEHAGSGLERLERALRVSPEPIPDDCDRTSLNQLRQHVFRMTPTAPLPNDGSVRFFSATDEGRECVEIARNIRIAATEGTRFDRIAILLRHPEVYQTQVEDALVRAGIPAWYTRGSIRPNPAGRAFLALLQSGAEGLSATRFAEYLSLGQVPRDQWPLTRAEARWVRAQGELFASDPEPESMGAEPETEGTEPSAPFDWERLLGDAAVIGGHDRWVRRLDGLHAELRTRIQEVHEDDARRDYLERQVASLDAFRRFALPVIDQLARLPGRGRWAEWLGVLEPLAARTLAQPDGVLEVLAELRAMGEVGPVSLDEVQRVLSERLSFLRDAPPGGPYGKVFVGTIAESAGRSFEYVFLPGLAEGVFPRKTLEDPLLLDQTRTAAGFDLPVQGDRSQEERLLLHLAAGAAERVLSVSYPRMDVGQGRSRVPSFYALDILRAAEGAVPDLAELEQRATRASMSRLGWPSPVHANHAIDSAEYDLATIGALLERRNQRPGSCGGEAHYLMSANMPLARSLRTRARRWRNFWSEADGIVDPDPETRNLLAAERPTARAYSATALEQFARCPYQFLLRAIHRLHPREEVTSLEQLDPLTRGGIFHTIQFRVLDALRGEGQLPVTVDNAADAGRLVDAVLEEAALEFRELLAPAIDRIWASEIEDLGTDMRGWIRQLSEDPGGAGWTPAYFELAFGMTVGGDHDPASVSDEAVVFGDIRLRGSIDLIEKHADNHLLRIIDHKTGRSPASAPGATGGGKTLQPMLYAVAAEAVFGEPVATTGLWFCTERGGYRKMEVDVDDRTREAAERAVRLIDQSIADGFLPAAPDQGACTYCDYRIVCGPYEESRTARKRGTDPPERMERIQQLRALP